MPEGTPVYADELDQGRIDRAHDRWLARLRVRTFFLRHLNAQLFRCQEPWHADMGRAGFAAALRGVTSRRPTIQFPAWRVAGTTVAYMVDPDTRLNHQDMPEIDRVAEAYFHGGAELEPLRSHPHHLESMELHEDDFTDHGLRPPLMNRFDDLVVRRPELADLRLAAEAKEVDFLQSIAYVQSEVLRRMRERLIVEPPVPAEMLLATILATRCEAGHARVHLGGGRILPVLPVPVVLGAGYCVTPRPRPSADQYLDQFRAGPEECFSGMTTETRYDVAFALDRYVSQALPFIGNIQPQRGEPIIDMDISNRRD